MLKGILHNLDVIDVKKHPKCLWFDQCLLEIPQNENPNNCWFLAAQDSSGNVPLLRFFAVFVCICCICLYLLYLFVFVVFSRSTRLCCKCSPTHRFTNSTPSSSRSRWEKSCDCLCTRWWPPPPFPLETCVELAIFAPGGVGDILPS